MTVNDALARKRAAVNDRMRCLSYGESDEPIAFLCECGYADCFRTAWLTPAEFDHARERGLALQAGHPAPTAVRSSEQPPSGQRPMAVSPRGAKLRKR